MQSVRSLSNFVRVLKTKYVTSSPLGCSHGPSRFSPPSGSYSKFGIIYGAADLATASYESIIRDRFDAKSSRDLEKGDYNARSAVNVSSAPGQTLNLLDLTGGNAVRHSVPTDIIRYSNHADGQRFSEFVHANIPQVDGFLYASRLTEVLCVAIYDRAIPKLAIPSGSITLSRSILSPVLAGWNVRVR